MAYEIEGKPYRTKIASKDGATCMYCGRKIPQRAKAIGVRQKLSFFYYHITHWPLSRAGKKWMARARK